MDKKQYKSLNRALKRGNMSLTINDFTGLIEFRRRTNTNKKCNFLSFVWPPVKN